MTRYTINIGDEFPLNDERPGASGRRWGFGLRAVLVLALAAIVLSHPVKALLLVALALYLRKSTWFVEAKARWRAGRETRRAAWRAYGSGGGCRTKWTDRRDDRGEKPDRYKAFV